MAGNDGAIVGIFRLSLNLKVRFDEHKLFIFLSLLQLVFCDIIKVVYCILYAIILISYLR